MDLYSVVSVLLWYAFVPSTLLALTGWASEKLAPFVNDARSYFFGDGTTFEDLMGADSLATQINSISNQGGEEAAANTAAAAADKHNRKSKNTPPRSKRSKRSKKSKSSSSGTVDAAEPADDAATAAAARAVASKTKLRALAVTVIGLIFVICALAFGVRYFGRKLCCGQLDDSACEWARCLLGEVGPKSAWAVLISSHSIVAALTASLFVARNQTRSGGGGEDAREKQQHSQQQRAQQTPDEVLASTLKCFDVVRVSPDRHDPKILEAVLAQSVAVIATTTTEAALVSSVSVTMFDSSSYDAATKSLSALASAPRGGVVCLLCDSSYDFQHENDDPQPTILPAYALDDLHNV